MKSPYPFCDRDMFLPYLARHKGLPYNERRRSWQERKGEAAVSAFFELVEGLAGGVAGLGDHLLQDV